MYRKIANIIIHKLYGHGSNFIDLKSVATKYSS